VRSRAGRADDPARQADHFTLVRAEAPQTLLEDVGVSLARLVAFARQPLDGCFDPHDQPAPEANRIILLLGRELLGLSAFGLDGYFRPVVQPWQNGSRRIGFQLGSKFLNLCY
jgi:hypothetical protein